MPESSPLVPVRDVPPNAEIHPGELEHPVTPTPAFFVRCNFPVPSIDPAEHRIRIGGAVERAFVVSVEELRAMELRTVEVTTECAGNGRIGMQPPAPGVPWDDRAVSTAVWTGVPLRLLLERAGVSDDAVEVRFDGADGGELAEAGRFVSYARSLPLEKALDPDTLVALEMNGEPIPAEHGAPTRLIVPGWYGMASVKWLTGIELVTEPFQGWFQRDRYVYDPDTGEAPTPVTSMRVRSIIHRPLEGSTVKPGTLHVRGWAWSGDGSITKVEVALGGGDQWVEAALESHTTSPYAWVGWSCSLEVRTPGRHLLRSRAWDSAGERQPDRPPWNRLGYGQNAVRTIAFEVH
ncbi:MAG: sulfite oxidase [Gemmatimonadales bacterium]|nr:MAG: sulfite oxidase [Gemmatimonadales bacterium]